MLPRVFFVTGTDTDVGKTVAAAALLRAAARQGLSTLAVKPIAAGCEWVDGRLVNDDALALAKEITLPLDYADLNPVALEPAIAPHLAAARAKRPLGMAELASHCRRVVARGADWTLFEGAGGWLVPLNDSETLADLCQEIAAEVILVVGLRLGCLNHALLTVADIARRDLKLAGWVANAIDPEMAEREANLDTLARRIDAPCLGRVPYAPGPELIETAARSLDLGGLT